MKAVILAAGVGSRLGTITRHKPKCIIRVGGKTILTHQIRAYVKAGIKDIIIVVGYKSKKVTEHCKRIKSANIKIIENKEYETTNNMYSLYLAHKEVDGKDFILSNGDVVFSPEIVDELVNSDNSDNIVCDKGSYNDESMKIIVGSDGYINDISKRIPRSIAYGNSIDLYKFSSKSSRIFFKEIYKIIEEEDNMKDWVEVALQRLLKRGHLKMRPFDIKRRHWVEIDNIEDLLLGDRLFNSISLLKTKNLFLIDLDGTIYLGDKPIDGAREFIAKLRAANKHIYFLSNNSSKSKKDYVTKLSNMGIQTTENEIVLSTDGVIEFLLNEGCKDVFVIGTDSMKRAFREAGFDIESENPKYVVLGYDTELTYSKIRQAALLLQRGTDLLATHCDVVCPTPAGPIPDIGSMLALFRVATGKTPLKVFGKPSPEMVAHLMKYHGVTAKDIVVIADRLYTDMELARRIGCEFICVLSGETKREDIERVKYQPNLIVNNVGELIDFLR